MIPKKHGRVSIKAVDGKEHSGYYHVENVWVTVTARGRNRKSLLSSPDSDPELLAETLLQEIVNDAPIK
jgi:hypothetical protein